ncbi:MAG: site-specific DNA-methyltransferase [Rhodobacteraceae bacterium]|nr:site-specific DNA-methyltransferase [Paracoccaceae bacterium]
MHDVILRYAETEQFCFNVQYEPYSDNTIHRQMSVDGKTDLSSTRNLERGTKMNDVWHIPHLHSQAKERTGHRTQKPLALLRRIIAASSNEGDMILDPFCGCATACIAAEDLGRQWAGTDIGPKAADPVQIRMEREMPPPCAPRRGPHRHSPANRSWRSAAV